MVLLHFFPLKELSLVIPPGLWWYVNVSRNSPGCIIGNSDWDSGDRVLKWGCAGCKQLAMSVDFSALRLWSVCLTQVSQLHVICHCTTHAVLEMVKYVQMCSCMNTGTGIGTYTPVSSYSRWGYTVCIWLIYSSLTKCLTTSTGGELPRAVTSSVVDHEL